METAAGQIFTFYSYKGGTGRSMALANVACLLADTLSDNEKILIIDWDLEAPGLHRFFDKHLKLLPSLGLNKQPGLIDLFIKFKETCETLSLGSEIENSFFQDLDINNFTVETHINHLSLMTAGQFDDLYPTRVNTFNWEELFTRTPSLISGFASYLSSKFKYTLIDSRTGFTDISNICTSLMPERLVLVFTPNTQSLIGVLDQARQATSYRKRSNDLRPLIIFPVVSRVENAEEKLLENWRYGNTQKGVPGYQPLFENILKDIYGMAECSLDHYFDDIVIQHVPRYSYGEEIAVLSSRRDDRLSLTHSYEKLAQRLVEVDGPWQELNVNPTTESGKLRVFIAHAAGNESVVRDLYQRLKLEVGIDPWLDEAKLLPGQDWSLEVSQAARIADVTLVCLSNSSITREGFLQKEIRFALDRAAEKADGIIYVIPVRLEDCPVPNRLKSWKYVDYFPEEERASAFESIRKSLLIRATSLNLDIPMGAEIPLYQQLVQLVAGDRAVADRLIEYERRMSPQSSVTVLIERTMDRLLRDRR